MDSLLHVKTDIATYCLQSVFEKLFKSRDRCQLQSVRKDLCTRWCKSSGSSATWSAVNRTFKGSSAA